MKIFLGNNKINKLNYIRENATPGSEVDSLGNPLTPEQSNYFKNSKVRDSKDRLLVCTHCTDNEFDTFDKSFIGTSNGMDYGYGFYFSATELDFYGSKQMKCYLDIKNPFFLDLWSEEGREHFYTLLSGCGYDDDIEYYRDDAGRLVDNYGSTEFLDRIIGPEELTNVCIKKGYDGIVVGNMEENEIIAFEANQIKNITNQSPTNSSNINEDLTLYRVGDIGNGTFFADNLDYYDHSMTDYNKKDAKAYSVDLSSAKVFDPMKDLGWDANTWSDIEGKIEDFEKYNIYYESEEGDTWGHTSTDDIAYAIQNLGYDVLILRDIRGDHGYGPAFNEYVIYNTDILTSSISDNLNESDLDDEDRIINSIVTEFKKMSTEELVKLVRIPHKENIDTESPMFILPDGTIVSVKEVGEQFHYDLSWVHGDMLYIILNAIADTLGLEYPNEMEELENDLLDYLTYKLGWVRINCGTTWTEDRFYCVLPHSMTNGQYRSLEKWIEWGYDNKKGNDYVMIGTPTTNHIYQFRDNFPEDIIKNIKRYYSSGKLYENVNTKNLSEGLHKLGTNCFITDSPYDIKNLIINKPKLYRILYDSNIDMYMIGDGNEIIHWDMIRETYRQGYYHTMEEFIEELGGTLDNYVETGMYGLYDDGYDIDPYLLYMVFSPDEDEFMLGEDGYDGQLKFNFGNLFLRDADQGIMDNCDLIRVLQKLSWTNTNRNECKESMNENTMSIDPQVSMQLNYLKRIADDRYNKGSRREYENIYNYKEYQKEIDKNGDKNLLVKGKLKDSSSIRLFGVKPFARRYKNSDLLVHRPGNGGEILVNIESIEVVTEDLNENKLKENLDFESFEKTCFEIANNIIKEMDKELLNKYGFEIELVTDYEDYDDEFVGMFLASEQDNASVFPIVINPKVMWNYFREESIIPTHSDIVYTIESTLWHEVGHGIVSYLSDVYDFDWDEEQVVEDFAIQMCETHNPDCELIDALNEFENESLKESNELEQRAKKHKKKSKGMGWHMSMNAGNVEKGIEVFNNSTGNVGSGDTGMSMGESVEKKVYRYVGPVYYRGMLYRERVTLVTKATTRGRALANILYQAAGGTELQHFDIEDNLLEEPTETKETLTCDNCGHPLNDMGQCPACDQGEEELYDDLSSLEALWELSKLDNNV